MAETRSVLRALGKRIKDLRTRRGVTQEALAERVGMDSSNYARIEQGRQNVTVGTLVRIANALDLEVSAFFGHAAPR